MNVVQKNTEMRPLLLHHQYLKSYLTLIAMVYPNPWKRRGQTLIEFYRRMWCYEGTSSPGNACHMG